MPRRKSSGRPPLLFALGALVLAGCQTPIALNLKASKAPVMLGPVRHIGGQAEAPCAASSAGSRAKVDRSSFGVSFLFLRGTVTTPYRDAGVLDETVTQQSADQCVPRIEASAREVFVPALLVFISYRSAELDLRTGVVEAPVPQNEVVSPP